MWVHISDADCKATAEAVPQQVPPSSVETGSRKRNGDIKITTLIAVAVEGSMELPCPKVHELLENF